MIDGRYYIHITYPKSLSIKSIRIILIMSMKTNLVNLTNKDIIGMEKDCMIGALTTKLFQKKCVDPNNITCFVNK